MAFKWMTIVGAALLAGCATNAELAAQMEAEVAQMIEVYGPACEKLGYRRDEDGWRDCVVRLAVRSEQRFNRYPITTTCFGRRSFLHCNSF